MLRDELTEQTQAFHGNVPDGAGGGLPDEPIQLRAARSDSRQGLTAVSARSTPADAFLLEQRDFVASLGKMQRCGASRDSRPHDTYVALDRALQPRPLRGSVRRDGVVRRDVRGGTHERPGTCGCLGYVDARRGRAARRIAIPGARGQIAQALEWRAGRPSGCPYHGRATHRFGADAAVRAVV